MTLIDLISGSVSSHHVLKHHRHLPPAHSPTSITPPETQGLKFWAWFMFFAKNKDLADFVGDDNYCVMWITMINFCSHDCFSDIFISC